MSSFIYLFVSFVLQSNMVSPFAMHQQQLAMLAHQQSLLMAATAKSGGAMPSFSSNGGYQFPGMIVPGSGKNELENYMQQVNKIYIKSQRGPGTNILRKSLID